MEDAAGILELKRLEVGKSLSFIADKNVDLINELQVDADDESDDEAE